MIPQESLAPADWQRLRQAVRLAALLHDVGHPPLSHTTEMLMPPVARVFTDATVDRRATHEDFTLKIITDLNLTHIIEEQFASLGISAHVVANLVKDSGGDAEFFLINGIDYAPLMRQIISSEIDADRMDYLLRDSFFCGVNYGKFDAEWLIDNLVGVLQNQQMFLGLRARAIFAFEDFLLSRYHMFASVYLHHTPVIMEKMLERFFKECPDSFALPAEIDSYIALDDGDLWQTLKLSNNKWARRIVERRPYLMLEECFGGNSQQKFDEAIARLTAAGIDVIASRSQSVLSTYRNVKKHPVFVETTQKIAVPLEEFSQLFARYQTPAELARIFVDPVDKERAVGIIRDIFVNDVVF